MSVTDTVISVKETVKSAVQTVKWMTETVTSATDIARLASDITLSAPFLPQNLPIKRRFQPVHSAYPPVPRGVIRGAHASGVQFSASRRKPRPQLFCAAQRFDWNDEGSGATPKPARGTRALPLPFRKARFKTGSLLK
jgi:hypothetical protein